MDREEHSVSRPSVLTRIVESTRIRLASNPLNREDLEQAVTLVRAPMDAMAAFSQPGVRIIAEVKRRSPSAGTIRKGVDPLSIARSYADAGAAAVSVLTEPEHFGGSLNDLKAISERLELPCMRKDFIVDELQILEARAHGASMVLLIAAILDDHELMALRRSAEAWGMAAMVETHTAEEVRRAVQSGALLIGVNNRNLKTFEIDLTVAERLRPLIPTGAIAVAESGISTPSDLGRLRKAGYDVFLIGTVLMQAKDPARSLKRFLETGRS
jgi:indole-3-glycerol phosphate synthase